MSAEDSALTEVAGITQPPSLNRSFVPKPRPKRRSAEEMVGLIRSGDRAALSQAITLIESTRPEDGELARAIVDGCTPHSGNSLRVGITGVPGVGKSTFIEALGRLLVEQEGHRIAVLAIDPSSQLTGGSILGDKSRMTVLAANPNAFVRPSPSRGSLGGVTRRTREAMLLCEAAGYDVLLVETVGVGQSESAVHSMVDCFLLLMLAGAGDELQGIKRGIMEMADVLAITKVDGDNINRAKIAQRNTQNALHFFPPDASGWLPPVLLCSSVTGEGIANVWREIRRYQSEMQQKGLFEARRAKQAVDWLRSSVETTVMERFYRDEVVQQTLARLEAQVRAGSVSPHRAAEILVAAYDGRAKQ